MKKCQSEEDRCLSEEEKKCVPESIVLMTNGFEQPPPEVSAFEEELATVHLQVAAEEEGEAAVWQQKQ